MRVSDGTAERCRREREKVNTNELNLRQKKLSNADDGNEIRLK